jgi:hypothetical protein
MSESHDQIPEVEKANRIQVPMRALGRCPVGYNPASVPGGADMAKTKQFTIAVDNQPGAVAGIAKTLGNAKVNILSLLGTAQGNAGTVQLVVDDARRAKKALDAARIAYAETPAEQYDLPNKPGALAQSLEKLAAKGVNLNSIHATAAKGGKKAVVVYTVEAAAQVATATA